jgi:hypothetical protein
MKLPSPETMKKRFHELKAEHDKLRAKADPVRAKRDELAVKQAKEMAIENAKVRKAEAGLFEIEQEMAALVRAVGGSMGEPE